MEQKKILEREIQTSTLNINPVSFLSLFPNLLIELIAELIIENIYKTSLSSIPAVVKLPFSSRVFIECFRLLQKLENFTYMCMYVRAHLFTLKVFSIKTSNISFNVSSTEKIFKLIQQNRGT
jgi:hypothetical protein